MRNFVLALAAAMTLGAGEAQAARQVVTLGAIEGPTPGAMAAEMAPVLKHLQASTTVDIQLRTFPSHDAVVAALKSGKVELGFLGPVKYVEAHDALGVIPIVAEGKRVRAYIVVPKNSPIKTVAELKGKKFAFGYEDSTTTHLIPLLLLSKHGIKKDDLKSTFVGEYPQKLIDAMLAGKYDAAAASEHTLDTNGDKVRAIEKSDEFAGSPIVARKDLDPKIAAEVQRLFVSYKAAGAARSARFGSGVTAVTDDDYKRIRFLCKVLFDKTYH